MKNGYIDAYVLCPLYSREESNERRKIYCEGYKKGIYLQMYFENSELKKEHKKIFCKNEYCKCPLFQGILEFNKENNNG